MKAKPADVSITVPQDEGEVLISLAGADPTSYPVKDGTVTVPAAEADQFLRLVPGAQLAPKAKDKEAGS